MSSTVKSIQLETAGLGIIFYSPENAKHIEQGDDYLSVHYTSVPNVRRHVREGTIVGFATGTPGKFRLRIQRGKPAMCSENHEFNLTLPFRCIGGRVCFRDLYDLMDWNVECPRDQELLLRDGAYRVMVCSNTPPSGQLGDNQMIDIYFQRVDELPEVSLPGAPYLCP
ncbi:hypothetical protein ACYFX5_13740 [Bremerella sp. T1]|uniref:hypothetical protein n=1 Tax=Bremerella sp. TYQ1 TaxID=3119568 RepID=UPI001CCB1191|nr:hypothetical protein [Bremerella volcania]UBM34121.1 hypothetical protein LA756_15680 [Bremerella volcania]